MDDATCVKTHAQGMELRYEDILYCTASSDGNMIHLKDQTSMHTLYSLKKLMACLPPYFERIHHSCIVNINAVREINDHGQLNLTLNTGAQLPISVRRKSALLRHFTKL